MNANRVKSRSGIRRRTIGVAACLLAVGTARIAASQSQVPTTLEDFHLPGTQPGQLTDIIESIDSCDSCHGNYDPLAEPLERWAASMMGQSMRDPLAVAALAVANQDAAFAGDLCLRCHSPGAWLEGRSTPTDGSAFVAKDFEGVSCHVCHRMVDPIYDPGVSPASDQAIIAALTDPLNVDPHSGTMIIDPDDVRRGPFDLVSFNRHDWAHSPYHSEALMCATCHDVSNPVFSRQPDGTYALNALDTRAPSDSKYDQFPVERTYSEWLMSAYAAGPVETGGRFGGAITAVSTCQDCHQPDRVGAGCKAEKNSPRPDLPSHNFHGGNTWLLKAVRALYDDSVTNLSEASVADSIAMTIDMLERASDLELSIESGTLRARVVNECGHKLPTGYPEGRRMWINVRFFDDLGAPIAERGAYDDATATLTTNDTVVFESKLGITQEVADATGHPTGESFHFALNSEILKDNRIPPRGYTVASFEAVQAAPVGATYADGQHWHDEFYDIPAGSDHAEVRVYYQTASREYIEFLRDEAADGSGQTLYDLWADPSVGAMGAPIEMDFATIVTPPVVGCAGDIDGDGATLLSDFGILSGNFGQGVPPNTGGDFNGDGQVLLDDFGVFASDFGCTP